MKHRAVYVTFYVFILLLLCYVLRLYVPFSVQRVSRVQHSLYLIICVSASSNKGRGRMDGFLHQSSALRLDQVMNEDVLHDLEEGCNL